MILLVDLCYREDSLGFDEYLLPLARIAERLGYQTRALHFRAVSPDDLSSAEAVILCGTPLADNAFLEEANTFLWLEEAVIPVLGVCAGMEIICRTFGGMLGPCTEIGMSEIRMGQDTLPFENHCSFPAFELHTLGCTDAGILEVLAVSDQCVQIVRHPGRPIFGVMFHPEVRNEWVVEQFLSLPPSKGSS